MIRHSNGSAGVGVALMAAFCCLGAERPAEDKSKQDLERIQGTWVCQKATNAGEAMPPEVAGKMSFTFKDDRVICNINPDDPATIQIDATQTPCAIDFIDKDKKVDPGIYKFEGDALTFCMATSESKKPRPAKFESTRENQAMLVVMKKQEPKKK
jgi:uncharacterized protein (TIGR03067 family)